MLEEPCHDIGLRSYDGQPLQAVAAMNEGRRLDHEPLGAHRSGVQGALIPERFYARGAEVVAPELLGMLLCRDGVVLRITEVEAYRWPGDTGCHARHGRTARNDPLWGPPGRAYVYLCYGLHHMLNLVTGRDGEAGAVLVRAAEPVAGLATLRARRRGADGPALLAGPGRLGAALALDLPVNRERLFRRGGLEVRRGAPPEGVLGGARIGIDYAEPAHRALPWRFAIAGSRWVSRRAGLRPLDPT